MPPPDRDPVSGTSARRPPGTDRPGDPADADRSPETAAVPEVTVDLAPAGGPAPHPEATIDLAPAGGPAPPPGSPDFAETKTFYRGDAPTPADPPPPADDDRTGAFVAGEPLPDNGSTRSFGSAPVPSLGGVTQDYSYGLNRAKGGTGEILRGPAPPGYEILGELGRGGMGVVYKARQVKLNRIAALKMILAGVHAGDEQLQRFQTEAEASARLTHPGIVQVYESGEHDGLPYFALEYVEGGPLHKKTKKEPQPPELAAAITQALARAIQYAHDHNVVHRDLKPANVLVGADGTLKIADFGLAKKLEEEDGQTLSGSIVGTPQYMAPEQARGDTRHAGPAADQYSLGAILYELLTGRPPLAGATILETLNLVQNREPVPIRDLLPKTPIDLETICLKCLQKDPAKRYESAGELADDLGRFLHGLPILARPVGPAERLWRWCRRNPRVAGLLAGVAGLLVTIAVGSMAFAYQISKLKDAETEAKELAEANEKRAKDNAELARKNELRADEERGVAVDSLLGLATSVQSELGRKAGLQDLREKLFKVAADGITKAGKRGFEPKLARAVAGLYQQQGDFFRDQVPPKTAEAIKMYGEAHRIAADLEKADPENPVYQLNVGAMTGRLGEVHRRAGDIPAARRFLEETVARRERVAAMPADRVVAALVAAGLKEADARNRAAGMPDLVNDTRRDLGTVCMVQGDPAAARVHFQAILDDLRRRSPDGPKKADSEAVRRWAGTYDRLGETAFHLGDAAAARADYQKALDLRQPLADKPNPALDERRDVTISYARFGDLALLLDRDPKAAAGWYDRSLAARRANLAADPKSATAVGDVADECYRLATAHDRAGDPAGAAKLYAECLEKRRSLAGGKGPDREHIVELLLAHGRCGDHATAAKLAGELAAGSPDHPGLQFFAGCGYALCRKAAADPADKDRYAAEALKALGRAVDKGWKDRVLLDLDPDLDGVRDLPGFRPLADRVPKPAAEPGKS